MASANFGKDSIEWAMFGEYWKMCQKLWVVEDNNEYWDTVIKETGDFARKYESVSLAKDLAMSLVADLDKKYHDMKGEYRDTRLKMLIREVIELVNR